MPTSANYSLTKASDASDYLVKFGNVLNDYTGAVSITDTNVKPWLSYLNSYPSQGRKYNASNSIYVRHK